MDRMEQVKHLRTDPGGRHYNCAQSILVPFARRGWIGGGTGLSAGGHVWLRHEPRGHLRGDHQRPDAAGSEGAQHQGGRRSCSAASGRGVRLRSAPPCSPVPRRRASPGRSTATPWSLRWSRRWRRCWPKNKRRRGTRTTECGAPSFFYPDPSSGST